jgi:hypothetical protein
MSPPKVQAKFIEPMLLLPAQSLPEGAGWLYELLCGPPHNVRRHRRIVVVDHIRARTTTPGPRATLRLAGAAWAE